MIVHRKSVVCLPAVVGAVLLLAAGGTAIADENLTRAGFTAK